ncbi:hypothetical protein QVD17_14858 [Tagetes erecta]|uniref:Protein kinase domain-containing protein n=1 Tax=Tagetes erecta TaxID=13708 RepID=A0AAD8KNU6_TARER|nr:hypothetical protein QVD17_14858 [Tagetes erecta]
MPSYAKRDQAELMAARSGGNKVDLMSALAQGNQAHWMLAHAERNKPSLTSALAEENKTHLMSAYADGCKYETSAQYVQIPNIRNVRTFTYAELVSATNNFNDKESSTYSLETIYKGWVDELTYAPTKSGVGLAVYVRTKHIEMSKLDLKAEEFNHPNLVRLLGYYLNEQEMSCVYELIPSLDKLFFGEQGKTSLSWVARLKIAVGAAQGLSFLHKKGRPAYNQLKTACIMVDADYNARLQEFEVDNSYLAPGSYPFEMDAHYAAPEWFHYQNSVILNSMGVRHHCEEGFGVKCEIYSFGVVLLELLTGMKVFDRNRPEGTQNLVKWATPLLTREVNLEIVLDKQIQVNNHPPKGAFMLARLVSYCLEPTQCKRPSMEYILQVLRQCYLEQFCIQVDSHVRT